MRALVLALVLCSLLGALAGPSSAEILSQPTFSGGAVAASGPGFQLQGTLGETGLVGEGSGSGYQMTLGFWGAVLGKANPATGIEPELPGRQAVDFRAVPNPFNPVTHFHFHLPAAGEVTVRVHDVAGRLVRVLRAGELAAGDRSLAWNGRDDGGRTVSSGQYYARLVVDGKHLDRPIKLSLLK